MRSPFNGYFWLTLLILEHYLYVMTMFRGERRWKAWSLRATLCFCLVFFQYAVAMGTPARLGSDAGLGSSRSGFGVCAQLDKGANKGQSPHGHSHKNCVACATGEAASSSHNSALAANRWAPFLPDVFLSASSASVEVAGLLAAGFASSWSSRAPPILS